jgi:hypothetical protein
MNYKQFLRWGIFHIIFIIFLTIANYKVFGFEFTIMYLMLETVASIMGTRLELIRLLDKDKVD